MNHQLGVNRNTRHQIERDLANKDHSINIDHTCHNLMNTSRAINLHGGIEKVDPNISIPETWADFSNRNIQASQCKDCSKPVSRQKSSRVILKSWHFPKEEFFLQYSGGELLFQAY